MGGALALIVLGAILYYYRFVMSPATPGRRLSLSLAERKTNHLAPVLVDTSVDPYPPLPFDASEGYPSPETRSLARMTTTGNAREYFYSPYEMDSESTQRGADDWSFAHRTKLTLIILGSSLSKETDSPLLGPVGLRGVVSAQKSGFPINRKVQMGLGGHSNDLIVRLANRQPVGHTADILPAYSRFDQRVVGRRPSVVFVGRTLKYPKYPLTA